MTTDFDVVVERDAEGNYVASVPSLQGCHTQAQSLDELMERVREVIALCLEEQGGLRSRSSLSVYRGFVSRHDSSIAGQGKGPRFSGPSPAAGSVR